ncbi:relaxase/mobilization nuclease domain-containing protein [Aquipuribacter hungaricus]
MAGLIGYLVGPGRSNEHTEPHLVAGDPALMAWHDDAELAADAAAGIARHLDRPRTAYDVTVPGGHVWHCSLSLRAEEGLLTDERWAAIAADFVAEMGFDDRGDLDWVKAPCRWVAVRHGVSGNGNDHIHIAVNLVREDGTKASVHHDFRRAQTAARGLEVRYGLEQLESATAGRAGRAFTRAEQSRVEADADRAARRRHADTAQRSSAADGVGADGVGADGAGADGAGGAVPVWEELPVAERRARVTAEVRLQAPRNALARTVRGCATASLDEAEFVRRLRRAGVLVRARFADGRSDVVTGYSVAARPPGGERPIWYGGGHLGRDLTLPRLRGEWPDTPTGAGVAAAEWTAAGRGRRVVAPGRESLEPAPELWQRYSREVAELRKQLRAVPAEDRETWARVARHTAGAFAAWSSVVEPEPGDLAAAADALARSAQTYRRPVQPQKAGLVAVAGTAMLLASAARGGQGTAAQAIMLRQLVRLAEAVHDAARASGEARRAGEIAAAERAHMRAVASRLPHPQLVSTAAVSPAAATAATGVGRAGTTGQAPDVEVQEAAAVAQARTGQRPASGATASRAPRGSRAPGSPVPDRLGPARPRESARPGADRAPER